MAAMNAPSPHRPAHAWRGIALAAAVIVYVACTLAALWTGRAGWSVTGVLILLTVVLWPGLRHGRARAWLGWTCLSAILLVALAAGRVEAAFDSLAIVINAGIGLVFARTLGAGREPLITALVRQMYGEQRLQQPGVRPYTRVLTRVWAWVLFLQAGLLLLAWLLVHAGWPWVPAATASGWLHGYLRYGSYAVIAGMFLIEHAWRAHRLPHLEHPPFLVGIRRIAGNWQQMMHGGTQ